MSAHPAPVGSPPVESAPADAGQAGSGHLDAEELDCSVLRPIQWSTYRIALWGAALLYGLDGVVGMPLALVLWDRVRVHWLLVAAIVATLAASAIIVALLRFAPGLLRRSTTVLPLAGVTLPGLIVTAVVTGFGPGCAVTTGYFAQAAVFAFALLRLRWAVVSVAIVGVEAALVFGLQDGWPAPVALWIYVSGGVVGIAGTAGALTARVVGLVESESRARGELADLNATLQERVDEQVAQLERAGELRRFLAPQVADAVLAGDGDAALAPHRRKVAVFFSDLRGFTAFTASVEPEDVIDVLGDYYSTVGQVLRTYDATVGGFAGDGVMAYLNDPVPCDDPAATAVRMACEVRAALAPVIARWRRLGFDLGVGIGVAVGHATLGVVGYEGRSDYTALGTVVNLAARLCDAARDGQVLVDLRTADELPAGTGTERVDGVRLKGFPPEMEVRAVV